MSPEDENKIRHTSLAEYLQAYARKNGSSVKDFFKSSLFSSLVIFLLTQAFAIGGVLVTIYLKTSALTEWKGNVDSTLKRMDESGTHYSHWIDQEQQKRIDELELRMKPLEIETYNFEVIKSEHRRLTKDVELLMDQERQQQHSKR